MICDIANYVEGGKQSASPPQQWLIKRHLSLERRCGLHSIPEYCNGKSELRSPVTVRKRFVPSKTLIYVAGVILMSSACTPTPNESMLITKEIRLSPGHLTAPQLIVRAANGDYVVAGAVAGDHSPWAIRVSASGEKIWEYVEGGSGGWSDRSMPGQGFFGAVDLPSGETMLCGRKGKLAEMPFVVRIRHDGSVVEERVITPSKPARMGVIKCVKWGDGVAVYGGFGTDLQTFGWLAKLDFRGNLVWEKYSDAFKYGDVTETVDGGLILVGDDIVRISANGEVVARAGLRSSDLTPGAGEAARVRPISLSSKVRLAYMVTTYKTEVADFDEQLRGPLHVWKLENAGVKKAVEFADGSVAVFGSQFLNGATASVARLYTNGNSRGFLVQPSHQSGWFSDAVSSGSDKEFATVRQVNGGAVLAWVSFK